MILYFADIFFYRCDYTTRCLSGWQWNTASRTLITSVLSLSLVQNVHEHALWHNLVGVRCKDVSRIRSDRSYNCVEDAEVYRVRIAPGYDFDAMMMLIQLVVSERHLFTWTFFHEPYHRSPNVHHCLDKCPIIFVFALELLETTR